MSRSMLALLAASSLFAAPVPKPAETAPYFATVVGAKWVYERDGGREEAVEVSEVEKVDGELVVSRTAVDGEGMRYTKMIVSAAGLRQEGVDGKVTWLLKAKLRSGESWDVPDGKRTVHGPEKVEVPAGTFTALRVEWEHAGGKLTSWYAPGVGEVKRVAKIDGDTERVTRLLKSFKAK